MNVRPESRAELLRIVRSMLEPTRVRTGCLSYHLYQDVEDKNAFALVEEWQSEEALKQHMQTSNYRKLLVLLELLSKPPEIKFNSVSRSAGLEYVEEVL